MIYDLAIIGRGIAGLSVAFRIKQRNVVIIGKSDDAATICATGINTHKGLKETWSELFKLKSEGFQQLPKWIAEIESATYQNIPLAFGIEEHFLSIEDGREIQRRIYKDEPLEKFDVKQIGEGFFYPKDFVLDVEKMLLALSNYAQKNHVVINQHVHEIVRENGIYALLIGSERIQAKNILLACGENANLLLSFLKLPPLNISLREGKTFFGTTNHQNIFKGFTHRGHNLVFLDSKYRLGSSNRNIEQADAVDFQNLTAHFKFPLSRQSAWRGKRVRFKDRMPQVLEIENISASQKVFFVGGFYKSGFQFADLMAQKFLNLFERKS